MNTVVVTGAGGFIGGALTAFLLDKGITVYGVDVSEAALSRHAGRENFVPVVADFTCYETLSSRIPAADVFYHFAWQGIYGDPFRDYSLQFSNAKYACDAFMAAENAGCRRFVFAGSANEYEMDKFIKVDSFEPRYAYIYSAVKQAVEAVCKTLSYNHSTEYCAGRVAVAYGERCKHMTLPNAVIKNLVNNLPCRLIEGRDPYDMIYIDDIVEAFYAIGEKGVNMKSYYVGHRQVTSFKELIKKIADILNPQGELLFGAYPDAPTGVDYDKIDLDALYRDTGFECRSDFRESIIKTAEWIKSANL